MPCLTCLGTRHTFGELWNINILPNVLRTCFLAYEAELEDLQPWCVAGRAVWMAMVPLVCFHLVERHTSDCVVRQFGMIQEIPCDVDIDTMLHDIDLKGKIGVDWMQKHAMHIMEWGNRLQWRCEVMLGDMPPQHEYFDLFKRVTRRFINIPNTSLFDILLC